MKVRNKGLLFPFKFWKWIKILVEFSYRNKYCISKHQGRSSAMVSLYIIYTRNFCKKESYVWDQFWEIYSRAVENLTAKNWLNSQTTFLTGSSQHWVDAYRVVFTSNYEVRFYSTLRNTKYTLLTLHGSVQFFHIRWEIFLLIGGLEYFSRIWL